MILNPMSARVLASGVIAALSVSSAFGVNREIALTQGESAEFQGYTLTYLGAFQQEEANRTVLGAGVEIARGDTVQTILEPRLNQYPNQVQAIPTPAVRTGLTHDLYLSLARIDAEGVILDVFYYPWIMLVWIGGFVIAAGAVFSVVIRKPTREREPAGV